MEVVKEECRAIREVITKMVEEMEQKAEKKTVELGKRIGEYEDETRKPFKKTEEELSDTRGIRTGKRRIK